MKTHVNPDRSLSAIFDHIRALIDVSAGRRPNMWPFSIVGSVSCRGSSVALPALSIHEHLWVSPVAWPNGDHVVFPPKDRDNES